MIKSQNWLKWPKKYSKNEKNTRIRKKPKSHLINAQHHQPGASEASGPTRIRFCAKNQKNQHQDPKNPKNQDPDLDSNSKPLKKPKKNQKKLKKKPKKIRMNESHFLLQMSNFQKKIFFWPKISAKKKYLEKIRKFLTFEKWPPGTFFDLSIFTC